MLDEIHTVSGPSHLLSFVSFPSFFLHGVGPEGVKLRAQVGSGALKDPLRNVTL
jgi:hypothetical protein